MDGTRIEVRGIIASKQGLSCEGYYTLSNETSHLRERLYVSVRDGQRLFLPTAYEHFPCSEIEDFYVGRMNLGFFQSIGAGGGEVVFSCEGEAAGEAAEIISRTLFELEATINQNLLGRWASAIPQKRRYLRTSTALGSPEKPYRPERLPERAGLPKILTEEESKQETDTGKLQRALATFEEKKRQSLAEWGLLEAYDKAFVGQSAEKRSPGFGGAAKTDDFAPWKDSPWSGPPGRKF